MAAMANELEDMKYALKEVKQRQLYQEKRANALAREVQEYKKKEEEAGEARTTACSATKSIAKIISRSSWSKWTRRLARSLKRFDPQDRVRLTLGMLRIASEGGVDLRSELYKHELFAQCVKEIRDERDVTISKHLREVVYPPEVWATLRLVCQLSKRECSMIDLATKYRRLLDGSRVRQKLAPDSKQSAPQIFSLADIASEELKAATATCVAFQEHADRRGADVAGAPFSVDQALFNALKATDNSRTGGMATEGTPESPHLILLTGDGARLSQAESGVRLAGPIRAPC